MHQEKINGIIKKLIEAGETHPLEWICSAMEITPEILNSWVSSSVVPENYAIKYLEIISTQRCNVINTRTRYSESEDNFLIKNYANLGAVKCAKQMKRSEMSIKTRSLRLGLHFMQATVWLEHEDEIVRKEFPTTSAEEIAEKLNRTPGAVAARASFLEVRKLKKNGQPVALKKKRKFTKEKL